MQCSDCGYEVDGLPAENPCPECGLRIAETRRRRGPMDRWAWLCWHIYLAALIAAACFLAVGIFFENRQGGSERDYMTGIALVLTSTIMFIVLGVTGLFWRAEPQPNRPRWILPLSLAALFVPILVWSLVAWAISTA